MIDIIMEHHNYVPCLEKTETQRVPGTCEIEEVSVPMMHHIMFGGDHITKVRAMSAIKQRVNTHTGVRALASENQPYR